MIVIGPVIVDKIENGHTIDPAIKTNKLTTLQTTCWVRLRGEFCSYEAELIYCVLKVVTEKLSFIILLCNDFPCNLIISYFDTQIFHFFILYHFLCFNALNILLIFQIITCNIFNCKNTPLL